MKYYRLVFILEIFMYKKFIKESLTLFVKKFVSKFMSGYRKIFGTNHAFWRLPEDQKTALDNKASMRTVLMGLCKAFGCILSSLKWTEMGHPTRQIHTQRFFILTPQRNSFSFEEFLGVSFFSFCSSFLYSTSLCFSSSGRLLNLSRPYYHFFSFSSLEKLWYLLQTFFSLALPSR